MLLSASRAALGKAACALVALVVFECAIAVPARSAPDGSHIRTISTVSTPPTSSSELVQVVAQDDGDAPKSATEMFVDAAISAFGFYLNHHDTINQLAGTMWNKWQSSAAQTSQQSQASVAVGHLLAATPQLIVDPNAAPCGGPNTIFVQYRKDRSIDCAAPNVAHAAQINDAQLLFVATVDQAGRQNNAMVYQMVWDSNEPRKLSDVKFLGTVAIVDHPNFSVDYSAGHVVASFDNPDATRSTCIIGWAHEHYQQKCL